jgi:DNA-binding CsgD family transcriptional regulator
VWALLGLAQSHLLLGEVDAAAAAADRADDEGPSPLAGADALRSRTRAWLAAARGDLAGARALVEAAADDVRADGLLISEAWLRHDVVRFGAPEVVADRLAALAVEVEGPFVAIAADHARAAAARDRALLGEVAERFETAGFLVGAAEAAAEVADLHRRAGAPRDATAADQRVARLVERTGARTPGLLRGTGVEPLTAREREVALLAAGGASSKDIAATLYLSSRTVDTHLARVYRKLGISGRDQLPAALEVPTAPSTDGVRPRP